MPETSIVVKATDRYSDTVKSMRNVTRSFSKDVDDLDNTLSLLNKNKAALKVDVQQAKQALKEAQKQFDKTGDAADRMELELRQANYDQAVANLKTVTKTAQETEKAISKITQQPERQVGTTSFFKKVSDAGFINMAGDTLGQAANTMIGSTLGSDTGSLASGMLSGAANGAAMGSLIGQPIVGAVIGGLSGLISGSTQVFERKDDAFRSYVQESYETGTGEQAASLSSGSSIAGSREQTQMAFAQKLGSNEAADAYPSKPYWASEVKNIIPTFSSIWRMRSAARRPFTRRI